MKKMMHLVFAGTAAFASAAVLAGGDKMNKQSGAQASPSAQAASGTQHSSAASAQSQSPETVKKVQEALTQAGYDPGPADGIMGQKTSQALKKAQSDKSLNATGQLDSQTLTALGVSEGGSGSTGTGASSSGSGASGAGSSGSTSPSSGASGADSNSSGAASSGSGASGSGASGSGASGSGASGSDSKAVSPQGSEKSK